MRDIVWCGKFRAQEVQPLFDYLKQESLNEYPLIVAGLDSQTSSQYFYNTVTDFIKEGNPELATIPAMTTRTITLSGFTNDLDFFLLSDCDNMSLISLGRAFNSDGADEMATITNAAATAGTLFIIVERMGWRCRS